MNPHAFTEPPVLAALIAALSALVLAVVQFFAQRKQSGSIEELKARLSQQGTTQAKYLETYLNLVLEGRQQQTQAYASLLQGIQLLRDKIRRFLEQPQSYDRDAIHQEISEQAEAIVTIYSANQLQFGEVGRDVAHNVKNIARDAVNLFEHLRGPTLQKPTNQDYLQQLNNIEEMLAELQAKLRRLAIEANSAFVRSLGTGNGK
jgi:hypothetical protein